MKFTNEEKQLLLSTINYAIDVEFINYQDSKYDEDLNDEVLLAMTKADLQALKEKIESEDE